MAGLGEVIEQYHQAGVEITNGDPSLYKKLYSEKDDITLANPFGPVAHGRAAVEKRLDSAAANYRDGEATGFEQLARHETSELACTVEVESYRAKVGGSEDLAPVSIRVTSIFRLEDGAWKVVHRHADPITTEQAPDSVLR